MTIDLGTGDGRHLLRSARAEPGRLFIGIDSNRAALEAVSRDALRKPARGGATNAIFVLAAAEQLPAELAGVASHVRVILPWGTLLKAVWAPDADVLAGIREICSPGAVLEVVVAFSASRDRDMPALLGHEPGDTGGFHGVYSEARFEIGKIEPLESGDLAAVGTTWAKKLASRSDQQAWRLTAHAR